MARSQFSGREDDFEMWKVDVNDLEIAFEMKEITTYTSRHKEE
jgi:hypothetical protein